MQTLTFSFIFNFTLQRGANKEPYVASIFVGLIAIILILIGNVNTLAPVVTMPFLMTYAAVNYAYFKLVMCMDVQKMRKLVEDGILINGVPKGPKTEESRLVSKAEMMDGLLAKDYGAAVEVGQTEKSDVEEKENLDKDSLEDNRVVNVNNVGVISDVSPEVAIDNVGISSDNVGGNVGATLESVGVRLVSGVKNVGTSIDETRISVDNTVDSVDNAMDNNNTTVNNRGVLGGDNESHMCTDDNYCELSEEEETELYNKEKENQKDDSKKKTGEKFERFLTFTWC